MAICILYYIFWIAILPYFGKYEIRQELVALEGESSKAHRLIKVPKAELEAWDAVHDVLGQKIEGPEIEGPESLHSREEVDGGVLGGEKGVS